MNLDARARASAQAIDRSAARLDPGVGLDELLRRRRRQPLRRAAAAAVALLVVVLVWVGVGWRGPVPVEPTVGPVTAIRVGPEPVSVALTPGTAWVLNSGNATISRVNPATNRVQQTFAVSFAKDHGNLVYATVADGKLWVVHWSDRAKGTAISAIDPSSNRTLTTFALGGDVLWEWLGKPGDVAVAAGSVWVALQGGEDRVNRFDAASGELLASVPLPQPTALGIDGGTVWVAAADGRLRSIDTRTGAVAVRATTQMVTRIRVGQGGVWLMTFDGRLLRLDPRRGRVVTQVPGAFQAADLAVGAEGVWVYDQRQGTVLRIDPATSRVVRTIRVIGRPLVEVHSHVLAVGDGAVWVVDKGDGQLMRVDPNG